MEIAESLSFLGVSERWAERIPLEVLLR